MNIKIYFFNFFCQIITHSAQVIVIFILMKNECLVTTLHEFIGHFFPPNTCSRLTCTRIPSEPCSFDTYILQLHTYLIDYIVHVWRQQQIFVWILSYLYTIFHSRIRIKVKSWDRILFQQTCVVFSLNPNKNSWKWSQVRNKEINFCILTIFSFG